MVFFLIKNTQLIYRTSLTQKLKKSELKDETASVTCWRENAERDFFFVLEERKKTQIVIDEGDVRIMMWLVRLNTIVQINLRVSI